MRSTALAAAGLVLAGLLAAAPVSAQAALSEKAIADKVAEAYPVQVLKVKPARHGDKVVYAVTMMRKAGEGAGSSAFQVVQILVDPMTGAPLPAFEHLTTGYANSATESYRTGDDIGAEARRQTTRNTSRQ